MHYNPSVYPVNVKKNLILYLLSASLCLLLRAGNMYSFIFTLTNSVNPLTAKLFNLNFHPPEVVSR